MDSKGKLNDHDDDEALIFLLLDIITFIPPLTNASLNSSSTKMTREALGIEEIY